MRKLNEKQIASVAGGCSCCYAIVGAGYSNSTYMLTGYANNPLECSHQACPNPTQTFAMHAAGPKSCHGGYDLDKVIMNIYDCGQQTHKVTVCGGSNILDISL